MRLPRFSIDKLTKRFEEFFDSKTLEENARRTGFVRRRSKITGTIFLSLVIFGKHLKEDTLDAYAGFLKQFFGIRVKKQSLDERFTPQASAYVKGQLEELFKRQKQEKSRLKGLDHFHRIRIGDCTTFQLPADYDQIYPGSGGDASAAALKIFFEYDFKSGQVLCLQEEVGKRSDTKFNEHALADLQANDLFIRDLGFYSLRFLAAIVSGGAFFVSRYKITTLLHYKGKQLRLKELISKMKGGGKLAEFEVELGGDEKIRRTLGKVRLIIQKLPPRAVRQKMKKLAKDAHRKSFTPSKEQKLMCHYNVYITNVEAEKSPLETIWMLYTVRWQIELAFKVWKSIFAIDKVKAVKVDRFQCFFYGCLISILLTMHLVWLYKIQFWNEQNKEISEWKVYRLIFSNMDSLIGALCQPKLYLAHFLVKLCQEVEDRGFKDKKKLDEDEHKGKIYKPLPIHILGSPD